LVSENGFVFSHLDTNGNKKLKSFPFKAGDLLYFQYDSIDGKLMVSNDNENKFEMNIEKGLVEKYAICVYFRDIGDSVELID
jgi:hypothetical protein